VPGRRARLLSAPAAVDQAVHDALASGKILPLYERRLPHGVIRWIRVDATETTILRTTVMVRSPGPTNGQSSPPPDEGAARTTTVSRKSGPALVALIEGAVAQGGFLDSTPMVRDGHRCNLIAIEAGATRLSAEVQLPSERPGSDPIECLCHTIVDLGDRVGSTCTAG
jgi:hypothetical protein